ncbi:MAG TPA: hypothetical protein VGJ13_13160 [Pseudonocardiaceae bacterium]|jgi:hypothetical protein
MAGDIGVIEQAIVQGQNSPDDVGGRAAAAVAAASGGVTHQYGPRVLIAAVLPEAAEQIQRDVPHAAVSGDAAALSGDVAGGLDPVGALGLAAFALRQSGEYAQAKAQRPLAGHAWDSGAAMAPDYFATEDEAAALDVGAGAPTSARLTGKVAVGVIIVEGPNDDLKFSQAERTKVVAEVQNGLGWLGSQSSPAGISWVYDIRIVSVSAQPNSNDTTFEQKEARFRDPALAALGFGPGLAGAQAYIEKLRSSLGTDWAYCAFFTKYPVGWFAYASIGGPRLVMDYNNDGWGPDNIDRVFAHESGHIFGCPDEYKASNCNCTDKFGFFQVANTNCETCAPGGGVPCLMKANTWEMCPYTPYHLGFPQGQRYSGVFTASSGNYGLWVNADWNNFVTKWQEWSGQGLRLADLEIGKPGGQIRYSGVFNQGTGGYGLWALADWNSFVAKWQEWSGQGLRLADLEITDVGGELRYSGVFNQGTGGYGLWANADWNNFIAKWQEWSNQGLRLVDFTITPINGQNRFSGVFVQGAGGHGLWANADWDSFIAKWQEWSNQGLRLIDLEISGSGAATRYSGVFRQGTGGHALWVNVDWASFRTKWQEWSGQGLRLVDFDVTLTGIEAATSPTAGAPLAAGAAYGIDVGLPVPRVDSQTEAASPAGFGALHLAGVSSGSGTEDSGAGVGMLLTAGATEDAPEGVGAISVEAGGSLAAGQGLRSLVEAAAQADTESSAGYGMLVGAGADQAISHDGGGSGYGGRSS